MNTIETVGLKKDYAHDGIVVKALQGVSIQFQEGEFTAVAGPSGSGKSTFLHLLGCLDQPTEGTVLIEGRDVATMKKGELAVIRRKTIGFIFQAYNLIPVLSAVENVSLPLILLGASRAEANEKSYAMLKEVGLLGMEKRRPKEMSGGQQQRVAIARALVKNPALILADEPTANLDSKTAGEILELMLKLNESQKTIFVFSTHDKLVMDYARRLIRLRDGMVDEEVRR